MKVRSLGGELHEGIDQLTQQIRPGTVCCRAHVCGRGPRCGINRGRHEGGGISRVSVTSTGAQVGRYSDYPAISGDGRFIAFFSNSSTLVPDDDNGVGDTFVRDLEAGTTELVSLSSREEQGNHRSASAAPSISADGRFDTSPSPRGQTTWSGATPTGPETSSSETGSKARPDVSPSRAAAPKATRTVGIPPSPPTAGSWHSHRR